MSLNLQVENQNRSSARRRSVRLLCGAVFVSLLSGLTPLSTPPIARAQGQHLITMKDADIRAFIDDVSSVTGRTFLVDPRVQGKVTISSQKKLSPNQVFGVFKDVMKVHGYGVVRTPSGAYQISLLQATAQIAPYSSKNGVSGQMASTVIKLEHVDAARAAKLIKPILHSNGRVSGNSGGQILVVTDFASNLQKARAIIAQMDKDENHYETISVQNIRASDAKATLTDLQGKRSSLAIVAMDSNNTITFKGLYRDVAAMKALLAKLDRRSTQSRDGIGVINLKYANGAGLVEILSTLLPSYARDGEPVPTIAHEPAANAIIISASAQTQAALEAVVRRLDVRRPQVLVEAIIVEVSETMAKELGVQFALAGSDKNALPLVSSNFTRSAPNMLALAGALAPQGSLSDTTIDSLEDAAINSLLGLNGGTFGVGSSGSDGLFAGIITAIQDDTDSNILSTPFVTTLDNEPAIFLVGQEIPITTGESLGSNNTNPFRTVERKEVGIKLDVLPQISHGDVIRLEIKQEVSSIAGALSASSDEFITNTREIETTVLANDGEIIVLGGLIQDDEQISSSKIPILGDAPIIGGLFRSRGKSRVRQNLMIFIRPTIIRNGTDARPLTQRRLEYMRGRDIEMSGRDRSKIDELVDLQ